MKILHLMLACFYIDNYSYQENYLPKHHKLQGHEVEIVASLVTFDKKGKATLLPKADKYTNEHGIPVTRLNYQKGKNAKRLRRYIGLQEELDRIQPELIFIHGVQFADIAIVARYCKKHPNVRVYADNHSDFSNSAKNWVSRNVLHKIVWRNCAQKINPYVTKFYGVLPARVNFLIDVYGLPKEKVELLLMGADDESVETACKPEIRSAIREQYHIAPEDTVIVTGGKIDKNKPETLTLMEAVNQMESKNVKMLVFGTVVDELKAAFEKQLSNRVIHTGWKQPDEIYAQFAAADIIAFPGLHSVLWEQAVAMGKPCLFRKIKGFQHIDIGGNCLFFEENTMECYQKTIAEAVAKFDALSQVAKEKGMVNFAYSAIAKKSIERSS